MWGICLLSPAAVSICNHLTRRNKKIKPGPRTEFSLGKTQNNRRVRSWCVDLDFSPYISHWSSAQLCRPWQQVSYRVKILSALPRDLAHLFGGSSLFFTQQLTNRQAWVSGRRTTKSLATWMLPLDQLPQRQHFTIRRKNLSGPAPVFRGSPTSGLLMLLGMFFDDIYLWGHLVDYEPFNCPEDRLYMGQVRMGSTWQNRVRILCYNRRWRYVPSRGLASDTSWFTFLPVSPDICKWSL